MKIRLTQEAYFSADHYEALGRDSDGNIYTVTWDIREGYDPEEMEEDMACDWDNPTVMRYGYNEIIPGAEVE